MPVARFATPASPTKSAAPTIRHWLAAALDELDYGIVLLFDDMRIVHVNEAALAELDDCHPLQLIGGELRARFARDVAPLHEAVTAASTRGIRKLLTLGKDGQRGSVSVIPLKPPMPARAPSWSSSASARSASRSRCRDSRAATASPAPRRGS